MFYGCNTRQKALSYRCLCNDFPWILCFNQKSEINKQGDEYLCNLWIYQFINRAYKREKPTHLAVVFDVGGKTLRHDDFEEYKANRSETPEAIKIAVPYIHQILEAMHIPILGVEGYEADDIIGTLSYKAEKEGYNVYMVTPDKDFAQLVTDHVKIYKPGMKGGDIEILGVEEVKAKYDIQDPKQVIDFLAMMGIV